VQTRSIAVRRTALYHLLGDPTAEWDELWFVLHGYGQLARRFLAEFTCVERPGRLIVAPEGLSRFYLSGTRGRVGASWMTVSEREREIEDYLGYLDAVRAEVGAGRADRAVGLLGFSQGAATAGRWAVLGAHPPQRLILWGGGPPPDLDVARARAVLPAMSVSLVAGERDEHVPVQRLRDGAAVLASLGADPATVRFEGGHHLDARLLRSLLDGPRPG